MIAQKVDIYKKSHTRTAVAATLATIMVNNYLIKGKFLWKLVRESCHRFYLCRTILKVDEFYQRKA